MSITPEVFVAWDNAIGVRRTAVLGITLWMTWRPFLWATQYAGEHAAADGAQVALVIAAVLAPISVLQAYVFKAYLESKP